MEEIGTTIPPKGLGSINLADFLKGLWISVGSSIIAFIYLFMNNNWSMPSHADMIPYINAIVIGFISYIGKSLTTNNVGQLFQRDKPIVHVDAEELNALQEKATGLDNH